MNVRIAIVAESFPPDVNGVLAKTVARRAVVDARHALDADAWRDRGWDYRAPGRSSHPALASHTVDVPPHRTALREAEVACLAAAI